MKKIYMIIAAASVMLAANSCNKENVPTTSSEPMVVKFTASVASTKTAFGDIDTEKKKVPVFWEGGENLDVCVNEHANAAIQNKIYIQTPEDDLSTTATWSYDFSKSYNGTALSGYVPTAPYVFYAFYPGTGVRAFHSSTSRAHAVKIQSLPAEQNPKDDSCDPDAMFLYSISDSYETWPDEVAMPDFQHMTAYGCLTLDGISGNVKKVTVTANKGQYLAGTAWFYYGDNETQLAGDWANYAFDRSIPAGLPPTETITINTNKTKNIWFGCRPTTDLTSLKFGVYTDEGYYEVTKDLTGTNKNFQRGVVSSMTITGFERKEVVTYTWTAEPESEFILTETSGLNASASKYTGFEWDASTKTSTQEFDAGFPSLHWTVAMTHIVQKNAYYRAYFNETTSSGFTGRRLVFGSSNQSYVDPLVLTIDPGYDWRVKKVTVKVSSGSNVVHYIDACVGETLVIDNRLLKASLDPDVITYVSGDIAEPVSDDVVITVSKKADGDHKVIYLYSVSLELEYIPTPQPNLSE